MSIRTKILFTVSTVFIITIVITIASVNWSLTNGVNKQIDNLTANEVLKAEARGVSNAKVLGMMLASFHSKLIAEAKNIAKNIGVRENVQRAQYSSLKQYLDDNYSDTEQIDFVIIFDQSGKFAESYPGTIDVPFIEELFQKSPLFLPFGPMIEAETVAEAKPQSGYFGVSGSEISHFGKTEGETTQDYLVYAVTAVIPNEFFDEAVGFVFLGKIINGYNAVFEDYHGVTNGITVAFYGMKAIAGGGFGSENTALLEELALPQSIKNADGNENGTTFGKTVLGADSYYATVQPMIDIHNRKIGSLLVAEKEAIVVEAGLILGKETKELKSSVLLYVVAVGAAAVLMVIVLMTLFSNKIAKPIADAAKAANKLSTGDLEVDLELRSGASTETVALMQAMQKMVAALNSKIKLAEKIAEGDLSIDVPLASDADSLGKSLQTMLDSLRNKVELAKRIAEGDLSIVVDLSSEHDTLGHALEKMTRNLHAIISQVTAVAADLSFGSAAIADTSKNLSEASLNQAANIEEIASAMVELEGQTKSNLENAKTVSQESDNAKQHAELGNMHMQNMLSAMNEINRTSEQVSNIIKTVDEIAFQTNVLAINAAVEAAHAGIYGKGFAVVAEEVRNLSHRSASASKETNAMVIDSIKKIEAGTKIVDKTAEFFSQIAGGTAKVTGLVKEITNASSEQAAGVQEISQGLHRLSAVVQSNAALAQESSATVTKFESQANALKELTMNFQLKQQLTGYQKELTFDAGRSEEAAT